MHRRSTIAAMTSLGMSPILAEAQTLLGATQPEELPARLVRDFHGVFGDHHARAIHAKGVILQGSFTPSEDASSLSKALVFTRSMPVTVRFSDFTGLPDIPDSSPSANPRGFAIRFHVAEGAALDIVTHSFNGFPTATAEEFSELLQSLGRSPAGMASPTPFETFLVTHPAAKTFFATQKPAPASFATTAFFGVNAFFFTDATGRRRPVRYRFMPQAGEQYLDEAALRTRTPSYLMEEITARVARAPVRFTWLAQLGEPGDRINDPSMAWPEGRELVTLGNVSIDQPAPNTPASDSSLAFLPGALPPGIDIADPMVAVRNAAYPLSSRERQ